MNNFACHICSIYVKNASYQSAEDYFLKNSVK